MPLLREMLVGTTTGAMGTVARNAVTYGDMLVRGRPATSVPAQVAGELANKVGLDLSAGGEGPDGPRLRTARARWGRSRGT